MVRIRVLRLLWWAITWPWISSTARRRPRGCGPNGRRNGVELVDWLEQAGTIEATIATQFRAGGEPLDQVAKQARSLREWFRAFVIRHAGSELGAEAVAELAPLNHLLRKTIATGRSRLGRSKGSDVPCSGGSGAGRPRAAPAADRPGDERPGLSRGLPLDPRLRRISLYTCVPGSNQGPCPTLVQHGRLRQSGQGRRHRARAAGRRS